MVPKILQNYFNSAKICLCGSACFESRVTILARIDLRRVSPIVVIDENIFVASVPAEVHFCSKKCYVLFTWPRGMPFQVSVGFGPYASAQQMNRRRHQVRAARTQPSLFLRTDRGDNTVTPWMSDFIHQYRSN